MVNYTISHSDMPVGQLPNSMAALEWLADRGAKFALPQGRSKDIFPKGWLVNPRNLQEATAHAAQLENVGILTGEHSLKIVALDLDIDFLKVSRLLGEFTKTASITRDNAPERGKLLYRIEGQLPPTAAWPLRQKDEKDYHPKAELLANGRHALCPPSMYENGSYVLDNTYDILTLTAAEIEKVWQIVTHTPLYKVEKTRTKPQVVDPDTLYKDEFKEVVRKAWPLSRIFSHFGLDKDGTMEESDGQTRLLGNSGLLYTEDNQWYSHGNAVGGDEFDAWSYCQTGEIIDRDSPKAFKDTLEAMATVANIPLFTAAGAAATLSLKELCARTDEIIDGIEGTELGDSIAVLAKTDKDELRRIVKAEQGTDHPTLKALFSRCVRDKKRRDLQELSAGRPVIETSAQLLDVMRDSAIGAIRTANQRDPLHPVLYEHGTSLARVLISDKTDAATLDDIVLDAMPNILADTAIWVDGLEKTTPPSVVAKSVYYAGKGSWRFPEIEKVVNFPTLALDGSLNTADGYTESTKLYYVGGLEIGDTEPTEERLAWAKSLILDDFLVDFPFVNQSSLCHAVALLLLPFMHPLIGGVTPLHYVDAPTPGTGKTLLVENCNLLCLGYITGGIASTTDDEEWRKRLSTALADTPVYLFIDNLPTGQALESPMLTAFLTGYNMTERILGFSEQRELHNRAVWVATGNNLSASDEMIRRILWIRLDANVERPSERTGFKHPFIQTWILEHRAELITACLILCRTWVADGMPLQMGVGKGKFERWSAVMGGLLQSIGIDGFLDNTALLWTEASTTSGAMEMFVLAWHEKFGDKTVFADDVFPLASHYGDDGQGMQVPTTAAGAQPRVEYLGLLDSQLVSPKMFGRKAKLGKILTNVKDQVYGGYKIRRKPNFFNGKPGYCLIDISLVDG